MSDRLDIKYIEEFRIYIEEVFSELSKFMELTSENREYNYTSKEKELIIVTIKNIVLSYVKTPSLLKKKYKINLDTILNQCGRLLRDSNNTVIWSVREQFIKKINHVEVIVDMIKYDVIVNTTDFSSNKVKDIPKRKSNSVWTVKK